MSNMGNKSTNKNVEDWQRVREESARQTVSNQVFKFLLGGLRRELDEGLKCWNVPSLES